ncbi:hypothetical protein [Isoptericola sp. NPDC057391]|uniref:hypothetical protein n=1 Tax=Isoptericola sp. NPDC057391 TaxID=3346117 RepID=UPI0036291847
MTVRYVIGPAYAVVRGGAVVVLPEKVTPELVEELWTALGEQAGVVPVLEVLTGSFGASLASLPPFAIAVADGRRVQVASRGATSVTVARVDGRDHVSGEGVTTWAERTFDDVVDLAVQVGVTEPDDLVDARALPLDAGVVLVRSVGARLTDDALPAAPARRAEPVPEPWEDADLAPPADAPAATPSPGPAAVPSPVASVPGLPDGADAPEATIAPESTIAPEATVAPGPAVTAGDVPRPATDPPAAGAEEAGDAADEAPVEETTGYGHLWGSTVHRAVEAAAVRPPDEDDDEDADAPADAPATAGEPAGSGDHDDAPEGQAAQGDAAPEPAAVPASGDAAATDGAVGPSPETIAPSATIPGTVTDSATSGPVPAVDPAGAEEVDGSTVLSSAIADLRAAAGAQAAAGATPDLAPAGPGPSFAPAPQPGRPMILARSCTTGHPNPPQRDDCAVCGQSLVGDARQVPRPALGVMGVSGGPRVTLDRPVVVGRRPRSPRATGDDLPRLVTVPSPQQDISRSHVEVRLEGWHVLVSDMSTTNGTTLLRAGQPPLRLHPGEPVLVVSRDVVDLGDGVTLTFEGIL